MTEYEAAIIYLKSLRKAAKRAKQEARDEVREIRSCEEATEDDVRNAVEDRRRACVTYNVINRIIENLDDAVGDIISVTE